MLPLLLLLLFGSPISHVKIDCNVHSVMEIYIRLCGALGVLLAKGNGPAQQSNDTARSTTIQISEKNFCNTILYNCSLIPGSTDAASRVEEEEALSVSPSLPPLD